MPRVVYYTATSFNGYVATGENSLGWLFEVGSPTGLNSGQSRSSTSSPT
jgi:hypothetical protein